MQERKTLENFARKSIPSPAGMAGYRAEFNSKSLDGLPGLRTAMKTNGCNVRVEEILWNLRRITRHWDAMLLGAMLAIVVLAIFWSIASKLDISLPRGVRALM